MRQIVRDSMNSILIVVLIGIVGYDHFIKDRHAAPALPAAVDGAALGRDYAPTLAPALADGWEAAASAIEGGKSMGEAQATLQSAFKAARVKTFTEKVAPAFARVLPEGEEPRDATARADVARLWRGFARGLKGGR
ncbi:hypothetical protein TA3x_000915 [Tundrisphaera sp. TA3]|uniref:hypothetical protein n=1 Tax=Tundrisphaera sp. TA3 TaxID=3435775 RepID=UPI003EB7335B